MENKKQFVIINEEKEKIEIADFTSKITLVTDLNFDRDGIFGFSIGLESNDYINITPSDKEDPYEAQISIDTEHMQLNLDKLDRKMRLADLNFSLTETSEEYKVQGKNKALFDVSEGVGNYYVDQYLEMENWHINLIFDESSQYLQLQMSANDCYDKHVGFKVDTQILLSNLHILIRGSKLDTKESLTEFLEKYFPLNDLHISFDMHEEVEGFKKEKKVCYDLKAGFK